MISASHVKLGVCVLLLTLFFGAPVSGQTNNQPKAADIIRRSIAVNTADWQAQPQYAHCELDIKKKRDSNGRVRIEQSKTYEVMMIEGSPYYRLIAVNNEPLTRSQEQQERAKLNKETERRQNESARDRRARIAKYQNERAEEHLLMQQMVAAFEFRYAGEQPVKGTDCYVLDATPNPDYRAPVERARVLTGMKGRLWIDKAHYHWAKVEAEVTKPVEFGLFIAKVKPGTRFELDQGPVGDVWLPTFFMQSVNATVLGMYGMHSIEEEHYSAYRENNLNARR